MKNIKTLKAIIEIKPASFLPGEVGVFAVRNLKKGTIIGVANLMEDSFMKWIDFNKIDILSRNIFMKFCATNADGIFVPENINNLTIPWFANLSCNPNLGFDSYDNIVTIKKVGVGEELCIDAAFVFSDPNFVMHCKCTSVNCRKVITGNDYKLPQFKKKRKYMISYLREII